MSKIIQGAVAVAFGATVLSAGVLAASAQTERDANDAGESVVPAGTLDDGQDLLPLAQISIAEAVQAAQAAASGPIGEVDLEYLGGTLVYNVDVGRHDVKVDASSGQVLAVDLDD